MGSKDKAKHRTAFRGSLVALITPMRRGRVEEEALARLVEWHVTCGTSGIVACGTTGESPTLTHEEHVRVIDVCVEAAAGRVPVMVGTGSNATAEAVALTRHAAEAGAAAALVVTPYYNKPGPAGLIAHYEAVSAAAPDLPLYIYNIPGRSVIDMDVATMAELARRPNIVGVKDASCDPLRVTRQRLACGEDFVQLSGEDATTLGFMAAGGHGCISVSANVAPRQCAAFHKACLDGDFALAREWHERLLPLHDALFMESSPGPVKYAVAQLGLAAAEIRLPLRLPQRATRAAVTEAMRNLSLSR